jgi:hypothetical protein
MFGSARDFHAMTAHFQSLHLQKADATQLTHHFQSLHLQGVDATHHTHHFQELKAKGNAGHAGVVGHGGKGGYPRDFGKNFKKGYLWYDNQVFWDHSFSYDTSNFENPLAEDHVEKSTDKKARWGWVMRKGKKKGKKAKKGKKKIIGSAASAGISETFA